MPNNCTVGALCALFILQLTAVPVSAAADRREAPVLRPAFRSAWNEAQDIRYAPAQDDDRGWLKTQSLMLQLMRGDRSKEVQAQARALGWRLRRGIEGSHRWTVLEEIPERRIGRGLYAFADQGGRHAIEAPHVPSDLHTGEIALAMGLEARPRAIAWNTVHRREADLPHLDDSAMHAFSRAFAQNFPQDLIVQLHGFDATRSRLRSRISPHRNFEQAGDSEREAILSSTLQRPAADFQSLAQCMRKHVESGTRLYGVDTTELGGTSNTMARELIAAGFRGFVHLELGLELRESLRNDPSLRRALLDCLGVPR